MSAAKYHRKFTGSSNHYTNYVTFFMNSVIAHFVKLLTFGINIQLGNKLKYFPLKE